MDTSTYIALSGQDARQRQMDVLANNIANMSTPGFKAERMMFQEYLAAAPGGANPSSYVAVIGDARDMSQGPITRTGNPFDVALNGPGFLTVAMPDGTTAYTRNGHLQLDAEGEIVTSQGYPVESDGGSPLVVPAGAGPVTIGTDGTVSTGQGTIGTLGVVNFDNPQALVAEEGGLYTTDQAAQTIATTPVVQGSIEGSNVQPIVEITRLMAAAREVTTAKNFGDGEYTRIQNAIDHLGKTI